MRSVPKAEFDKFIDDFTDGGFHEVQQTPHISLDGGASVVLFSNPDIGLVGEVHTERNETTYLIAA